MNSNNISRPMIRIALVALLLLSTNINAGGVSMSEQLYTLPQDCDFNAGDMRACAPQLLPPYSNPFSGILINAPKIVEWPKNDSPDNYMLDPFGRTMGSPFVLNIAGLYQLPYVTLGLNGDFSYEILVVAVNQKTAKAYEGKMERVGEVAILPELPSDSENDKNRISSSHFYLDLINDLNLPIANATYTVYATLGEYKSNVLTIKTIIK